ncbi:MAG: exodeoxyribonuclease VII small subunit [Selenomonadaceae bacterium]|nr:exodeoxyribonuclease VII small subunit [Selenomonadaceae bacterium]
MPKKKEPTFEDALERLEEITAHMENGDASLAELMKSYSEGIELSKFCMAALDRAEKTMDLLVKDENGKIVEEKLEIKGE